MESDGTVVKIQVFLLADYMTQSNNFIFLRLGFSICLPTRATIKFK